MHVAEVAREMGVDLKVSALRLFVGEPGAAIRHASAPALYGAPLSEMATALRRSCRSVVCLHRTSTHIPDDLVITEIVDPNWRRSSGE
jgi:hypothetical protein